MNVTMAASRILLFVIVKSPVLSNTVYRIIGQSPKQYRRNYKIQHNQVT